MFFRSKPTADGVDRLVSMNPATGAPTAAFETHDGERIEEALATAHACFLRERTTPHGERAKRLHALGEVLDRKARVFAEIIATEMGKPFAQGVLEVEKCARACRHYAEHGERYLRDEAVLTDLGDSAVRHLPLGVILAVMPWNFPFWQVFRVAAPAVAAGNTCLLKHASNVPRCAMAIERVFQEANLPHGTFQSLLVRSDAVEPLIKDPRIAAVTLTGSEPAGRAVAAQAGKAIKPSVLELGGSDAFIIMPSADLDEAARVGVQARMQNTGQSCIAAKRFLIHADVYDAVRERMADHIAKLEMGDPMGPRVDLGPLATASIRDEAAKIVRDSVRAGAKRHGAEPTKDVGYYVAPGFLEAIPDASQAATEELFAPVALLWKVADLDEAIARANATRFGLGSSIWTQVKSEQERAIVEIEAGSTFVNAMVASDPRLPFGGVKASGIGRELGVDGVRAFVNRKTVVIR